MCINMFGSDNVPFNQILSAPPQPEAAPVTAAIYFISFVVFGTMIILNLFIGVIIYSMNEAQKDILKEKLSERKVSPDSIKALQEELEQLEAHVVKIKVRLKKIG